MVNKKIGYWRVKTGFRKSEFISIPEGGELEKAVFAYIYETPTEIGGHLIRGKNIIEIMPDYWKHTGWNADYEPTNADDDAQIKRDCPDYTGILDKYKKKVAYLVDTNQQALIGKNVDIKLLN